MTNARLSLRSRLLRLLFSSTPSPYFSANTFLYPLLAFLVLSLGKKGLQQLRACKRGTESGTDHGWSLRGSRRKVERLRVLVRHFRSGFLSHTASLSLVYFIPLLQLFYLSGSIAAHVQTLSTAVDRCQYVICKLTTPYRLTTRHCLFCYTTRACTLGYGDKYVHSRSPNEPSDLKSAVTRHI